MPERDAGLRIGCLRSEDAAAVARWDAYVRAHAEATFFHLAAWQPLIREAFGHRTHFLFAQSATGRIVGVLPLAHVDSLLFGASLCSLPFASYGGVLADDPQVADLLEAHALQLAKDLGVDYLELRHQQARVPGRPQQDLYVTFKLDIPPVLDEAMLCIPQKRRNMVRKALKLGLQPVVGDSVERFYPVFAENAHQHGTPVLARSFFERLMAAFGREAEILSVNDAQGRCISSILCFYFRGEVLAYYAGESRAARNTAANDLKYWSVMQRAKARGCSVFDLGRSKKGTGSFEFKRLWGFQPQQLHYEYELVNASEVPQKNPLNPKYRLVVETWRRLPAVVVGWLGPMLVRNLG
ncbi:FemAB family XrtA/PEP-CTERM system-associated protein [Inhella sp.]|uniref:FemAB family XrtA/PEP-CTERM system-associated protein n=1 Tax=Inhella sp. TaxID=1921806 RepID=UPI0035B01730